MLAYFVVGVAVGLWCLVEDKSKSKFSRGWGFLVSTTLWPIALPLACVDLWSRLDLRRRVHEDRPAGRAQRAVVAALEAAGEPARGLLSAEVARVRALERALERLEKRRDELAEVAALPDFARIDVDRAMEDLRRREVPEGDRRLRALERQGVQLARLASLRRATDDAIETLVLELQEMAMRLRLARFGGSSPDHAVDALGDARERVQVVTESLAA